MRNTEISHLWNSFANHLGIGRTATTQLFGQQMDCNEPWDLQSGKPRTGSPFIRFKLPACCRHAGELTWRTFSGRCSRHRHTQGSDNSSRMPLSHLLFEVGISWMHSQFRQIYLPSPNSAWMLWRKRAETVACTLSTWSAPWRNLSVFNHNKASKCQCVCDWRIILDIFCTNTSCHPSWNRSRMQHAAGKIPGTVCSSYFIPAVALCIQVNLLKENATSECQAWK